MALACTLGELFVGSCVELVYLAIPTDPADRRSALLKRDEPTVPAAAELIINSAPLIRVG